MMKAIFFLAKKRGASKLKVNFSISRELANYIRTFDFLTMILCIHTIVYYTHLGVCGFKDVPLGCSWLNLMCDLDYRLKSRNVWISLKQFISC